MATTFTDQVLFNWGYHDAALDLREGRANKWAETPHTKAAYPAGYLAGFKDAQGGRYNDDSSHAWAMYCFCQ